MLKSTWHVLPCHMRAGVKSVCLTRKTDKSEGEIWRIEQLEKVTDLQLQPPEHAGGLVDEKLVDDHGQRDSSTDALNVVKTSAHGSTESSEDEHEEGASEKNLAEGQE
ncbi:hypothetical protein CDL15_Pgr006575 [Punica granatum]|uniref:Uncharacterized protein n=1 Tax=Punica granatum TaxID=22663 RepID=A0A218XZ66_PUNGR|nr:hypothetical protein CDL15_Pgr006575 [Punica granatum]